MADAAPGADALRRFMAQTESAGQAPHEPVPISARAATVVVAREGERGPEILMLRRPERGSFAGAWVFPGGKVDPEDAVPGGTMADELKATAVRETREETGLDVVPADLVLISQWEPPEATAVRIRTWFFVALAFSGSFVPSPDEVAEWMWIRPADMLERHAQGSVTLYPPTFVTLTALSTCGENLAAWGAHLREVQPRDYGTRMRKRDGTTVLFWQGDYEYDVDQPGAVGARHRIVAGALPWTYLDEARGV